MSNKQVGQAAEEFDEPLDESTYLDTRKSFVEMIVGQHNAFDKAVLTISTSAIALSILALTTFSESGPLIATSWLFISWTSFSASILLNLASYMLSARSLNDEIAILDRSMRTGIWKKPKKNVWAMLTGYANIAAFTGFSIGVFTLLGFSFLNANRSMEMAKSPTNTTQTRPMPANGTAQNGIVSSGRPSAAPSGSNNGGKK